MVDESWMTGVLATCYRALGDSLRKLAARSAGSQFVVRKVQVRVEAGERVRHVDVNYQLAELSTLKQRLLLVDLRQCPLRVTQWCAGGEVRGVDWAPTSGLRTIELPDGHADTTHVQMRLAWSATDLAGREYRYGLALPYDLPELVPAVQSAERVLRPALVIKSVTGCSVAGVPHDPDRDDLIDAVVAPGDLVGQSCILSRKLSGKLSLGERERVAHLTDRIIVFMQGLFGLPAAPRLLLKCQDEPIGIGRFRTGAACNMSRATLGLGTEEGEPNDMVVAGLIARAWWSGGCRVQGPGGYELQEALALYAALQWIRFMHGATAAERCADNLAKKGRAPLAGRIRRPLGREMSDSRIAFLAAEWASAAFKVPEWHQRIRQLTQSSWGHSVPSGSVLRMLDTRDLSMQLSGAPQ